MLRKPSLRDELDELRKEIEALRGAAPAGVKADAGPQSVVSHLEQQIVDLQRLVQTMLDEAEETVAEHPMATVAGALALGIVIGRLTAR
jgi:ElaB/YqjD/DUF883 family membrane-anchored ribosome-binding protein